jgi:hypothetical protein
LKIWEERYNDEKWGLETPASFNYFQQYLQQTFPRSIKALCQQINSQQESQGKSQTKLDTFYKYSQKWKWVERAAAYDEYLKQLHFQTKEKEVMQWESEQLALAKERAKVHSDTLNKIHMADEDVFPLTKKAYAEETNERAYNESIDAVYKLLHGGVIKSENRNSTSLDVDAEVKQDIKEHKTIEELKKENDDYFKQLEKDMEQE